MFLRLLGYKLVLFKAQKSKTKIFYLDATIRAEKNEAFIDFISLRFYLQDYLLFADSPGIHTLKDFFRKYDSLQWKIWRCFTLLSFWTFCIFYLLRMRYIRPDTHKYKSIQIKICKG